MSNKASSNHSHTFSSLTSKPTTLSGYGITDGGIKNTLTQATKTTGNSAGTFCNMCSLSVSAGTYLVLATIQQSTGIASDNIIFGVSNSSTTLSSTNFSIKHAINAAGGWNDQVVALMSYSSAGTIYALLYGPAVANWVVTIYAIRLY